MRAFNRTRVAPKPAPRGGVAARGSGGAAALVKACEELPLTYAAFPQNDAADSLVLVRAIPPPGCAPFPPSGTSTRPTCRSASSSCS